MYITIKSIKGLIVASDIFELCDLILFVHRNGDLLSILILERIKFFFNICKYNTKA